MPPRQASPAAAVPPEMLGWAAVVLVWGFAAAFLIWLSGYDIALQEWLQDHTSQAFNDVMRVLSFFSLGRTQVWLMVGSGLALALLLGGVAVLRATLRGFFHQPWWWLRGRTGWAPEWARAPLPVRVLLTTVWVLAVNGVLQLLLKILIGRPRPKEMLWNGVDPMAPQPFVLDAGFWSLPSGHASSAFAVAVWLGLAFPRWRWPLVALAAVVASSRFLAVTPHYVGDVVAGAALGTAVALVLGYRTWAGTGQNGAR